MMGGRERGRSQHRSGSQSQRRSQSQSPQQQRSGSRSQPQPQQRSESPSPSQQRRVGDVQAESVNAAAESQQPSEVQQGSGDDSTKVLIRKLLDALADRSDASSYQAAVLGHFDDEECHDDEQPSVFDLQPVDRLHVPRNGLIAA